MPTERRKVFPTSRYSTPTCPPSYAPSRRRRPLIRITGHSLRPPILSMKGSDTTIAERHCTVCRRVDARPPGGHSFPRASSSPAQALGRSHARISGSARPWSTWPAHSPATRSPGTAYILTHARPSVAANCDCHARRQDGGSRRGRFERYVRCPPETATTFGMLSMMYIPVVPVTPRNMAYDTRQKRHFVQGAPPPDLPPGPRSKTRLASSLEQQQVYLVGRATGLPVPASA